MLPETFGWPLWDIGLDGPLVKRGSSYDLMLTTVIILWHFKCINGTLAPVIRGIHNAVLLISSWHGKIVELIQQISTLFFAWHTDLYDLDSHHLLGCHFLLLGDSSEYFSMTLNHYAPNSQIFCDTPVEDLGTGNYWRHMLLWSASCECHSWQPGGTTTVELVQKNDEATVQLVLGWEWAIWVSFSQCQ